MPRQPRRPQALAGRVFRARDAIAEGLLAPADLRTYAWRRVLHGVYADSSLPLDHWLRCEAAALVMPASAAVGGTSAAWLHGTAGALLSRQIADRVEVVVPPIGRFGPFAGMRIHHATVPAEEIVQVGGIRVTTPVRTAWDIAVWYDPADAVAVLDQMASAGVVVPAALERYVQARRGARGWRRVARIAPLVDARSGSTAESLLRVHFVLAGLPMPVPQYDAPLNGGAPVRLALAWPEHRIAVEYDAEVAQTPAELREAGQRRNRLQVNGWAVLHTSVETLRDGLDGLVEEVRGALDARRAP